MPQTVQITINFNISPAAPPPIVASPSTVSLPATVGVSLPSSPIAVISGGTPPFSQPVVDPASPSPLPPGVTASIDASGNVTLSGAPQAEGSGTVILDVTDSGA